MKRIIFSLIVILCVCLNGYSQSIHNQSFIDLELFGSDLQDVDYKDIDSTISELKSFGYEIYVKGQYMLDYDKFESSIDDFEQTIFDDKYLLIGIYTNKENKLNAEVSLVNSQFSISENQLLNIEIENILTSNFELSGQQLIDKINSAFRVLLHYETFDNFINLDSQNKSSSDDTIVNYWNETVKEGWFLSLSGIPIKLPEGTWVQFIINDGIKSSKSNETYTQQGTLFSFKIDDILYRPTPLYINEKLYFGGYSYVDDSGIRTYYNSELSNETDPIEDVFVGFYSKPCGVLTTKKVIFNKLWDDSVTDLGYAGNIIVQVDLDKAYLSVYRKKYKVEFTPTGNAYFVEDGYELDPPESIDVLQKCDWYIGDIELNKLIANVDNFNIIEHKNGSRSYSYPTDQGTINYYQDNSGVDHYRMLDRKTLTWHELDITDGLFIKGLRDLTETSLYAIGIGMGVYSFISITIVFPQAIAAEYGLLASSITEAGIAVATYIVSKDDNGLIIDVAALALPAAITASHRIINAYKLSKILKKVNDGAEVLTSGDYKKAKKIFDQTDQVDNVITVIKRPDGSFFKVDHKEFNDKLVNELGFTDELIAKLADDVEALGEDYHILLDLKNVKAWKALSDLPKSKTWVRRQVPILKKMADLTPIQQKALRDIYSNIRIANPRVGSLPKVSVTKEIAGFESVTIHYDKYGFPKFEDWVPLPKNDYKFSLSSPRPSNDFKAANKELEKRFGGRNLDNFTWDGHSQNFTIKQPDGTWRKYTWHHHQDGKTLIPVPSNVHHAQPGIPGTGFSHTGGEKMLEKGLEGVFEGPQL